VEVPELLVMDKVAVLVAVAVRVIRALVLVVWEHQVKEMLEVIVVLVLLLVEVEVEALVRLVPLALRLMVE
jgi:hypothetical protein